MRFFKGPLCLMAVIALAGCEEDLEDQLAALEAEEAEVRTRIATIEDEALREGFNGTYGMLYWIKSRRLQSQMPPETVQYTSPEITIVEDYGSTSEMVQIYLETLAAELSFTGAAVPIEAFDFPLDSQLTWETVILEDGRRIGIGTEYDNTDPSIQGVFDGTWVRVIYNAEGTTPEDASLAGQIEGRFEADLPGAVLEAEFGPRDIGETQKIGPYEVTFTAQEDHQVFVQIERTDGEPVDLETDAIFIEARDETGQHLFRSSGSWGHPEQIEAMVEILDGLLEQALSGDLQDAEVEALIDEAMTESGMMAPDLYHGSAGFNGIPRDVSVTILAPDGGEMLSELVVLDVVDFDALDEVQTLPGIELGGPVYLGEQVAARLASEPFEIPADEIAGAITPRQNGYSAQVAFDYPDAVSGLFLDVFSRYELEDEAVEATFVDASGDPIALGEDAYDWTINRIEYDLEQFPVTPERVQGQFIVKTMPGIERERLGADVLPDWLEMDGNRIITSFNKVPGNVQVQYRHFARSGGRFLKPFKTVNYSDEAAASRRQVEFYYGQVDEIELFTAGPIVEVPYAFDVELVIPEQN
ncbi:hypothetical protein AAD018_012940 [Aestuariibius insulae]|uniref:hypothetical protein n=1 Tax=Aestuariibius insulae TaxID=2058287 RepID=UPI00345EC475